MLKELFIENYKLIDSLSLTFSGNLNIITGQTGAGKSMLLGAIELLLGARTSGELLLNKEKKCSIEGVFNVSKYNLSDFFKENSLNYHEKTALRREIMPQGQTKAFINNSPVTLQVLKQLGERLIDLHAQHETLQIGQQSFQLSVVDAFAKHANLLKKYQHIFATYQLKSNFLAEIQEQNLQAAASLDYLKFQLNELSEANLQPNEEQALEESFRLLSHAEKIKEGLIHADYILSQQDDNVLDKLSNANKAMQACVAYNPKLQVLSDRLESAYIELKDISSELIKISEDTQVDEQKLLETTNRLNLLNQLKTKHHKQHIEQLLALQKEIQEKIQAVCNNAETVNEIEAEIAVCKKQVQEMAQQLSTNRALAITAIETAIKTQLQTVAMPEAKFKIAHEKQLKETAFSSTGIDEICFLFTANKNGKLLPVQKSASGGELSRLMLLIKGVSAEKLAVPSLIFDEIDTGISGETALKVGRLLEQMAQKMQMIVITHLPQIASRGKNHYHVQQSTQNNRTRTQIQQLSEAERIPVIAEILSGQRPSASAILNATELLASKNTDLSA